MTQQGASVVWTDSLARFKVFGALTPKAFVDKCSQVPADSVSTTATVFIDILRATTTLVAVAAAGATAVFVDVKPETGDYPFTPPDNLVGFDQWVYGGELDGRPIIGTGLDGEAVQASVGNSPTSIQLGQFENTALRFFSTNGSRALGALMLARPMSIHAMSMANLDKTIDQVLEGSPERIWLACGGFYGGMALEDTVAGGFAVMRILNAGFATEDELDDEALTMLMLARYYMETDYRLRGDLLTSRLQNLQVGSLLTKIGHASDIQASLEGTGMQTGLWEAMSRVTLSIPSPSVPLLITGTA